MKFYIELSADYWDKSPQVKVSVNNDTICDKELDSEQIQTSPELIEFRQLSKRATEKRATDYGCNLAAITHAMGTRFSRGFRQ